MTFSIVARCPKTLSLGVCVATAVPAVGGVVPHAEAGVGAIATQAQTEISYGIRGLKLLKMGFSPQTALEAMLREDAEREKRQVAIVDRQGRTAAFTGKETVDWKGHLIGNDYVALGNMLAGKGVVESMAKTFEATRGRLADRLLRALESGQEAGGDKRGRASAALLVVNEKWRGSRPAIDLRVDEHQDPVKELRRIFEVSKKLFPSS